MSDKLLPLYFSIIEQLPVGILIVRVNVDEPSESILKYFNKQANKEVGLNLSQYLNKEMPELLVSKKGLLNKYAQVVETQRSRKLVAKLKEKNVQESNFSIVLLPLGEDYVAAVYQRIDAKIKAIELAKELDQKTEELDQLSETLEYKEKTIQELMTDLQVISKRIKNNGYKK